MNRNDGLLTPDEVAEYLKVNKYTIYRMVAEKRLPAIRIGNQFRFKRSVLELWLRKNATLPWSE